MKTNSNRHSEKARTEGIAALEDMFNDLERATQAHLKELEDNARKDDNR